MNPLSSYARNVTSQDGEDGIIEHIFEIIGTKALLIEADVTYFTKLAALYADNPRAHTINAFVSFEGVHSLDALCKQAEMPKDFDFLSLDIDGNDYHLWESMRAFVPRVVCIEFNPTIPNDIQFVQPRDMSVFQGSSLASLTKLASKKGYELVATTATNGFFVQKALFPLFEISDNSLDALHTDTSFQTRLYQLYDGTLKIAGYDKLFWHHLPIREQDIQVLPERKRSYPARIPASGVVRGFKAWVRKLPLYLVVQKMRKSI